MRRHRSRSWTRSPPFDGSMNETPSDVATAARGRSTISTPGSRPSAIAASISVRRSSRPGLPKRTAGARRGVDDARTRSRGRRRRAARQARRQRPLVRRSRPGRPAATGPVPAVDRSAMPVELGPAEDLAAAAVDHGEVGVRRREDRPLVGDEQMVDRMADRGQLDRRDVALRTAKADQVELDGRDRAVVVAEEEPRLGRVDGQGADPRGGDPADRLARAQVLGPDRCRRSRYGAVRPPAPCPVRRGDARSRRRGPGRRARLVARTRSLAPQDKTAGHRVLGQVRMGPLVDGMRFAVSPVLEELRGGPRVVDLVEMHLVRLFEAEGPEPQRRQDQHDEEPRIQAIQPPAALAHQRTTAIRPVWHRPESIARSSREGPSPRIGRGSDQVGIVTAARRGDTAGRRRGRDRPVDRGAPRAVRRESAPRTRCRARSARRVMAAGRSWSQAHAKADGMQSRDDRDADLGADQRPDAQPVGDRVEGRVLGRIDRGEDDVHVRERRDGEDHVGDPPARRDREQDRPEREEREPVALVDARRRGEEGKGDDRQRHEDREAVRAAPDGPQPA